MGTCRRKSKRPEVGSSDVGKHKYIRIVLGSVPDEGTIKYIVASPIIAGSRRTYERLLKSLLTTITTKDKKVTATDKMYDTAALFLVTAERGSGKQMITKVAMSFAGLINFY